MFSLLQTHLWAAAPATIYPLHLTCSTLLHALVQGAIASPAPYKTHVITSHPSTTSPATRLYSPSPPRSPPRSPPPLSPTARVNSSSTHGIGTATGSSLHPVSNSRSTAQTIPNTCLSPAENRPASSSPLASSKSPFEVSRTCRTRVLRAPSLGDCGRMMSRRLLRVRHVDLTYVCHVVVGCGEAAAQRARHVAVV